MRSDGTLGLDSSSLPHPGGEKPHHPRRKPLIAGCWRVLAGLLETCSCPDTWGPSLLDTELQSTGAGAGRDPGAAGQVTWLGVSPRPLRGLTPGGPQARSPESRCGVSAGYTGWGDLQGRAVDAHSGAWLQYVPRKDPPAALGGSPYQSGEAGGCWAGLGRPLRGQAAMLTVSNALGSLQSPGVIPQGTGICGCGLCPDNGWSAIPVARGPLGAQGEPSPLFCPLSHPRELPQKERRLREGRTPLSSPHSPTAAPVDTRGTGRGVSRDGGRPGGRGKRAWGSGEGAPGTHGASSSERRGEGGKEGTGVV